MNIYDSLFLDKVRFTTSGAWYQNNKDEYIFEKGGSYMLPCWTFPLKYLAIKIGLGHNVNICTKSDTYIDVDGVT